MSKALKPLFYFFIAIVFSARLSAESETAINPIRNVDIYAYLEKIQLPPGFEISVYVSGVTGARAMALTSKGVLFVGSFRERGKEPPGKVHAVIDEDGDRKADKVITVAENLDHPNGVAVKGDDLYVAEISRILRYPGLASDPLKKVEPEVISTFPTDWHHGWKYINFGPDGKLYVPVGAPCNICEAKPEYALIARMNPDGSEREVFARGVRNSVGFDWHPVTKEMYFTDNGRDLWGNNRPPEEINHAPAAGLHFGFPYRYGKNLVDTTYSTSLTDKDFQAAAVELPAHNACLGIEFYRGTMFPAAYQQQAFVACHGSWNRNPPDGYRVSLIKFENNHAVTYEHFATGWLQDEHYWGRPNDVEMLEDGSLLVSDDFNHVIYRITFADSH